MPDTICSVFSLLIFLKIFFLNSFDREREKTRELKQREGQQENNNVPKSEIHLEDLLPQ